MSARLDRQRIDRTVLHGNLERRLRVPLGCLEIRHQLVPTER